MPSQIGKVKKKRKIPLPSLKAMGKAVVKYREGRAAGTIGKSATMEALLPFFGKKGQVLKRETRYNTQRSRLKEAVKNAQQRYGKTPGTASFKREEKQRSEATKKAAETYTKKQLPKTKSGEADKRFTRQAREKAKQFLTAVEVFRDDTYNKMRDGGFGVGSPIILAMAEAGLSDEQILEYLKQIQGTWQDIPDEAKALAKDDSMWQSVLTIVNTIKDSEDVNFADVFTTFMTTDPDINEFTAALENYTEYGDTSKPFSAVWDELKDSMDPGSMDNLIEIMESEEENG